jgi:hypothetical protein
MTGRKLTVKIVTVATLINATIVCSTTIAYADGPISKSRQAAPDQSKQAGNQAKGHASGAKIGPSQVKIVDVNAAGIAMIDAGSKEGVQVGDKFICSSTKPSNEPVYRLIVKKTMEHSSEASIETTWGNLIERATHSPKGKFAFRYDGVDMNHEKDGGGEFSNLPASILKRAGQ